MSSSVMSWHIAYTVVFFVLISRSFQTAPITRHTLLFRHPDLDGRLVHDWATVRASSSVGDCAGICSADSDCLSVSFQPMSGECVIYHRLVSASDDFSLFASVSVYALCPEGYSALGKRCIKVVLQAMDQASAREICRVDHADLITLDSQAWIGDFWNFMEANGHDSGMYWCSASRVNGDWQWFNGMPVSSSSWCTSEGTNTAEGCAIVNSNT